MEGLSADESVKNEDHFRFDREDDVQPSAGFYVPVRINECTRA